MCSFSQSTLASLHGKIEQLQCERGIGPRRIVEPSYFASFHMFDLTGMKRPEIRQKGILWKVQKRNEVNVEKRVEHLPLLFRSFPLPKQAFPNFQASPLHFLASLLALLHQMRGDLDEEQTHQKSTALLTAWMSHVGQRDWGHIVPLHRLHR